MFDKRDKVVYVHRATKDLIISGMYFKQDQIVYVGSGNKTRIKSKNNRSDAHLKEWHNLVFEVVLKNLTIKEAEYHEQELILANLKNGLLNYKKTVDIKKDYKYSDISEIFYLDDQFNLRWLVDIDRGKQGIITKKDKLAGDKTGKYLDVAFNNIKYRVHRVIWVLYNKKDAHHSAVVDHIDGNSRNNHPNNLRLISYSANSRNRKYKTGEDGEKYITYLKTKLMFRVRIKILNDIESIGKHEKFFSLKPLMKKGISYEDARNIKLKEAIEYRNSVL